MPYYIKVNEQGGIVQAVASNVEQPNHIEVDEETYNSVSINTRKYLWLNGELVETEPTRDSSAPPQPSLFASVGITITGGTVSTLELAAQLASAYYEDGWIMFTFSELQESSNYLLFVQTDVPAKVEQFKDSGSFELLFSDPNTGDPIEPGRIDLQILKVR